MEVRIEKAEYQRAQVLLSDTSRERSSQCVLATAMREADPPNRWVIATDTATVEGDETQSWIGLSEEAKALVRAFDGGEAWPYPEDAVTLEALNPEETGTW